MACSPDSLEDVQSKVKPYQNATQHNVDACCSMIMLGFPLPPLPVMCLQGEDNADAFMSSHDLLARCVACAMLHDHPTQNDQEKLECLHECWKAIARLSPADHKQQYDVFCTYTRKYIGFYLSNQNQNNASPDVRFHPQTHVAHQDKIVEQTQRHFKARMKAMLDAGEIGQAHFEKFVNASATSSYTALVALYAQELRDAMRDAMQNTHS